MSRTSYTIHLGVSWARFATPQPGVQLLGRIERGQAFGAFAKLSDGSFAQVNGDVIEPLNTNIALRALRKAENARGVDAPDVVGYLVPAPKPVPIVTVKKRRIVQLPVAGAAS